MIKRNNYANIRSIGDIVSNEVSNDPVSYCINKTIDISFQHANNRYGQHCLPCQVYMSQKCANNWDDICEYTSNNTNTLYPNTLQNSSCLNQLINKNLTAGQILIRNTFAQKYITEIYNAEKITQPFDPLVASSPNITYYTGNGRIPIYEITDASKIDQDIVMNKVLDNPTIAFDILDNIYNTMKKNKNLATLNNTRLGYYYNNTPYFINKGKTDEPKQ